MATGPRPSEYPQVSVWRLFWLKCDLQGNFRVRSTDDGVLQTIAMTMTWLSTGDPCLRYRCSGGA